MQSNPVNWFEIYVQDMPRAKKFYEGVFQTTLTELPNPHLELWSFPGSPENPGAYGALAKMEGVDSGTPSTLVYFSCADCAVEAKRASELGGKVIREKMSIGEYGYIGIIIDTEGNTIGLHSME